LIPVITVSTGVLEHPFSPPNRSRRRGAQDGECRRRGFFDRCCSRRATSSLF
jgi:hypothetical protein